MLKISPDKTISYKTAEDLNALFAEHDFDSILKCCRNRPILPTATFTPGKLLRPETVREEGFVYSDESGIRAVIFNYTHSDGKTVRSIKRLVTASSDYRLQPRPATTPDTNCPTI